MRGRTPIPAAVRANRKGILQQAPKPRRRRPGEPSQALDSRSQVTPIVRGRGKLFKEAGVKAVQRAHVMYPTPSLPRRR
jgi:hypothetical protein